MLLSLQELLLPSSGVGQQLVPALHESGVASFDGLGLDVFGCQQLIFEGRDVGDALLLERLEASVKGLLQTQTEGRGEGEEQEARGGPETAGHATCLVSSVCTEDRSLP